MRKLPVIAILAFCPVFCIAQATETAYPEILWSPNDSFSLKISNYPKIFHYQVSKKDTIDLGTDGAAGLSINIYYGNDSLRIPYTNLPYGQVLYIPIQSPKGKTVYRLHFNNIAANFPPSYIQANKGNIQVEIPEVYELANILWTLSPTGQRATDLNKTGDYYKKVQDWFKPYMDHPVFSKLDFPDSLYPNYYFDFRENSFAYSFNNDRIVYEGPYYYVMGEDWDNYNSLFRELLPLVQDFAEKSHFREFYKSNKNLYAQQIARERQLLPLRSMWTWLEDQFPGRKYQSYKVVFSPLIGGSHSTQNFGTFYNNEYFSETVMFICNTDRYDRRSELTEKQREGLMSGVVFTEIDHNYVNPASDKYREAIDSIFSNRSAWTDESNNWYGSYMSVFNEYMTHAVFCLWVLDNYDSATASSVIKERESLMVNRRHFLRFREFNQALIALHKQHSDKKVKELYPGIIEWCRNAVPGH